MGDTNEPTDLKGYVMQCEDVAELHEIAKEKFGEVIHNRTGLEKSRERVLELIDGKDSADAGASDPATGDDQANAGSAEANSQAGTPEVANPSEPEQEAPEQSTPGTTPQADTVTISRAEYMGLLAVSEKYEELLLRNDEKDRAPRGGPGSKLRNTRTGREFAWTAALAKNKNMVEV